MNDRGGGGPGRLGTETACVTEDRRSSVRAARRTLLPTPPPCPAPGLPEPRPCPGLHSSVPSRHWSEAELPPSCVSATSHQTTHGQLVRQLRLLRLAGLGYESHPGTPAAGGWAAEEGAHADGGTGGLQGARAPVRSRWRPAGLGNGAGRRLYQGGQSRARAPRKATPL